MKRDINGLARLVALLMLTVIPVAMFWSWLPEASKEWLAVAGVVGGFWVAWEACVAPVGEDSSET